MMLHRSTSSRRCRASRNMNVGYSTTVAGSRGRRASVATDRPLDLSQTSPRGTMERSPRGSFVPYIALDIENDDEGINHRTILDRDQYGSRNMINQKISRSPPNSPILGDYYRGPRNGGRNSLVPDQQSLAPDMLYGSRHSLVPEATLSPRNSLVPNITHNRSPRNSIVPLTSSRTSLMSENGNPIPSRSPRHSLVPSMSRSPRGSITNMELVDRSPQRSPRGSIASDCINQSPRNSITPYEQMNRSSRGSIGMNELHRGSIGGIEEEIRIPRRNMDPDIIDRTPRGSIDGLPERRATKASLMAQDPRRASADQGMNGSKNSSPYRQKEMNSGSVKSRGSSSQINVGCGPSTLKDSRRASSSVSQFSNDESRRLFTNGASVPMNTKVNGNVRVVTYGSVVFQLRDANLEADNTCDFVLRALKVVARTRIATGCLVLLSTVPCSMLIYGWKFFNDCPLEPKIPIYMVVGGTFGIIFVVLAIYSQLRSRKPEVVMAQPQDSQLFLIKWITVILSLFLLGWFVVGNYWILSIKWPMNESPYYKPNTTHCQNHFYIFALVHLIVIYVVFAITFLVVIVLASFRILDCALPERYK